MNTAVAKQAMKQCFQTLTDEKLQQYHLTHDYFTGRPLTERQMQYRQEKIVDPAVQKKQRNLSSLNEVLYPAPTLGSVLGDSLASLKSSFASEETTQMSVLEKPSEDLVNRAKAWYDKFLSEGLESLLPEQSHQLSDANIAVVKRAFSRNTILIQNVCMLSAFWVRSPQDWDKSEGTDLLEYLFVEYDAPAFLKPCWQNVVNEDSLKWLLCYVLYAQGGSLKVLATHFDWAVSSHKLWHQLYLCSADMSPQEAVLYAEFKRLGGWDEDFGALMENPSYMIDLLEPTSEEAREFWYDTCRWAISKQFDLLPNELREILWWARHQYTEFARHGESYRLQGRSQSKLLESVAEYREEQRKLEQARARLAERARQVSMAREEERERLREEQATRDALVQQYRGDYYDYEDLSINVEWKSHHWNWSNSANGRSWSFRELTTSEELRAEGEAMGHCVGSYSLSCLDGDSAIFSVLIDDLPTFTIEVDPRKKTLVQAQGYMNSEPTKSEARVITLWLKQVVGSKYDYISY